MSTDNDGYLLVNNNMNPDLKTLKLTLDNAPLEIAPNVPVECGRHSQLTNHTFDSPLATIKFFSYYNDEISIYYELRPFVAALKTASIDKAIKVIPDEWMKRARDFNDPKFIKARIDDSREFVEGPAIQYLVMHSDNKMRKKFVESLFSVCFRRIEEDRHNRMIRKIQAVHDKITQHESTLESTGTMLKQVLDKHTEITEIIKTFTELIRSFK